VSGRGRPNFGFSTKSDSKGTFGLVSVSVGHTVISFCFGRNCKWNRHQNQNWLNAGCLLYLCLLSVILFSVINAGPHCLQRRVCVRQLFNADICYGPQYSYRWPCICASA